MSKPIRITFVIPTLDQSGAERQLWLLATHLPKSNFDVSVIALARGGFYADKLQSAGISVEVLGKRLRFDPLTFLKLRRRLDSSCPDIVQSFLFAANSYVRLPGMRSAKSKIVVSERCVDSWKSNWQLATDRRLLSHTDAMTANSESVAEFYRTAVRVPEQLITVIPNGVSAELSVVEPPSDLRRELGLPPEAKLVGFVGRLAAQKCLNDLVWAFQLLHQVVESVYLVIIGEGPEREPLAELLSSFGCREKAFFLGHRNDAAALTAQLNAFCLPSSFEGMSNSLMDAMAAGIPAVVSDIPANKELIKHEVSGLIFPQGSGPEITKALKRVLDDRELSTRLGDEARNYVVQHHSIDQLVQKHVALYNRLLSR